MTKTTTLRDDIKEFFAKFLPGSEDCMMKVRGVGDILWCKDDGKYFLKSLITNDLTSYFHGSGFSIA